MPNNFQLISTNNTRLNLASKVDAELVFKYIETYRDGSLTPEEMARFVAEDYYCPAFEEIKWAAYHTTIKNKSCVATRDELLAYIKAKLDEEFYSWYAVAASWLMSQPDDFRVEMWYSAR